MTGPNEPPFLILQKEYWKCPTHVFTGLTWFLLGMIVATLLAVFTLARPADAATLKETLCWFRADNARMIMRERQAGRNKFRLLRIVNVSQGMDRTELKAFRDAIEDAYKVPKAGTTFARRKVIDDFAEEAYDDCLREH